MRFALALAVVLPFACKGTGGKDAQYKVEKIDRGTVTMTVTATGTLSAVITVQVGSQVSGVISRLYADFNSRVKKGQLLAELDPISYQAQVEQRQADLTKARVDAANNKITYERQRRLAGQGLAAQSDLDAAKAAYDGAQAVVAQTTAALEQAKTNLAYTKIISPIDGVVVDRQYDIGQTVAASFQAPTLFSIAQDLTKMQVQADVDQSDIGRAAVGQVARFSVDAYPDEEFRGRIAQIRYNATVTQNVVTYPVIIEVPNPGERLRPKMTANVTIDVANVADVLRIPNAALRFKPAGEEGATPRAAAPAAAQQTSSGGAAGPEQRTAAQMGQRRGGFAGAAGALGHGGGPGGAPGAAAKPPGRMQTVYLLGPDNKPKATKVRTGITDGRFTQVLTGELKIGDPIIVGLATSKVTGPPPPGAGGPMGGRGR
ncbi:MAG TPA: efflux RND transporter periplasmic adaptor subunit [Thermoanaerobaculia bacterium]|nr:efflux RND transporter periplasmic adaptor subunit [Thermoanaerobaculia bacterium]